MALEYLRQNPLNEYMDEAPAGKQHRPKKKISKKKFSALLFGNLAVWVVFLISILDINVLSMDAVSMPHITANLDIKGIVYCETSPSVIISKDVYSVGDEVDGYTITNITRTEVEFKKGDKIVIRQVQ